MKHFLKRITALLLVVFICFSAYLVTAGYMMYQRAIEDRSIAEAVAALRRSEKYVTLEEVPDIYEQAVLAAEDHRFYKHLGVDPISVVRALVQNIKDGAFSQGGSTITQQLAKNMFFSNEKKLERKIAEFFVVYELEDNYAKDVILELYINSVYYGSGYYCIRDAAKGYFRCAPKDMTDYEATLLAGVPNAPSVYALNKKNELAEKRHEQVLTSMVKYRYITNEEKQSILNEKE